jgi:urease beta subunit
LIAGFNILHVVIEPDGKRFQIKAASGIRFDPIFQKGVVRLGDLYTIRNYPSRIAEAAFC